MWLISGVMEFENQYAPPDISHSMGVWIPFETTYYNGSNLQVEIGILTQDIDFWGALVDEYFILLMSAVPLIIGFLVIYLTGDVKFGVTIAGIYSVVIILIKGGVI